MMCPVPAMPVMTWTATTMHSPSQRMASTRSLPSKLHMSTQHGGTLVTANHTPPSFLQVFSWWMSTRLTRPYLPHHICHIHLGPVQVQTPEEPEPDLKSGSLKFRFKFKKICEPDPKSGSRFGEIYPRTGLNWTAASLLVLTILCMDFI